MTCGTDAVRPTPRKGAGRTVITRSTGRPVTWTRQVWSATNDAIRASAAFQLIVCSLVDQDWMSSM